MSPEHRGGLCKVGHDIVNTAQTRGLPSPWKNNVSRGTNSLCCDYMILILISLSGDQKSPKGKERVVLVSVLPDTAPGLARPVRSIKLLRSTLHFEVS